MNQTVTRIVDIMFQNTVMNDEVQALKDEVMLNCQERYEDLLAQGMSEDNAIAAVIDSLRGMEEVLAQYPGKKAEAELATDEDGEAEAVFAASAVKKVKVQLTADDVNFETSMDDEVHVYFNREEMPYIRVKLQQGTLLIDQEEVSVVYEQRQEQTKASEQKKESEWRSFSELLSDMGKLLGNLKVNLNLSTSGGEVTVAIPEHKWVALDIHCTSGDVDIDSICINELMVQSTSGDLSVDLPADVCPEQICVKGASGDVDISCAAQNLNITTISGDVEYFGDCPAITIQTVSGDVSANSVMRDVNLKTISGDVDLDVLGKDLKQINCKTTSGDMTVTLPAQLRGCVAVQLNSISGDVHQRGYETVGTPSAYISMQSVSGDLTVC